VGGGGGEGHGVKGRGKWERGETRGRTVKGRRPSERASTAHARARESARAERELPPSSLRFEVTRRRADEWRSVPLLFTFLSGGG